MTTLNFTRTRELLQQFDFQTLFIEELGWDHHQSRLDISIDGQNFTLTAIAQKRGMVAFNCSPSSGLPDYPTRRKIEQQTSRAVHEHLIIYTDTNKTTQIWQWVKREAGKPTACREHTYRRHQPGDALIQKLQSIVFSLEEENILTLPDVTGRARAAFDVDRITKRFYDRFKAEHAAFLKFLKGIPDEEMQRWYASVMLNRLMFIYFIQKKNFMDGNADYLRNKLKAHQKNGKDLFYSEFLCPLFFEGFAKNEAERSETVNRLLGKVPYLNGGLFLKHQIEELHGEKIQIADTAFENLFTFFEQYQWHLDERPLRADNEINPDVLGYIFEKYINQKQMGAYYTKEDITGYIGKNTIIPFLFDRARQKCRIAFEGDHSLWRLLQADPDRYIYDAVKKGVELPLPEDIAVGLNDVSKRTEWNKPAPVEYALPTEIWREVVARRKRYEEVRGKLSGGKIRDINDLITYNLNIRQFAQDVIENSEGPELLRAFWHAIESVTILDPTCGSGAFLFAALNILEPLYEACLNRMEVFIDDLERSGEKHRPEKFSDFRTILKRVEQHPNPRYFIMKSIILNNLYGVDIMDEAVEICKLRLFLKLVAQIERMEDIEPLPDIDFNIQAGNTLVGFATYADVEKAVTSKLDFENSMERIAVKVADIQQYFDAFRQRQLEGDGSVPTAHKEALCVRLKNLEHELNRYLANEYGINQRGKGAYDKWLSVHKPFHWFVEFHGILNGGGFDVIIGNPPYLEMREADYLPKNLTCIENGTIHALCIERSLQLLQQHGCMSMIVPLALVSTQRMQMVQVLLEEGRNAWYANYSWRPGKLFDTVNRALTIFAATPAKQGQTFSTNYQKWSSDNRDLLMAGLYYMPVPRQRPAFWVPKLGQTIEQSLLEKVFQVKTLLNHFMRDTEHRVYYRTDGGLYWKVFTDFPPAFSVNGVEGHSTRETWFALAQKDMVKAAIAALSSDIFWWWYTITSNCRHLNPYDIQNFPIPDTALGDPQLDQLGGIYLEDLKNNSTMLVRQQRQTGRTETQSFKIQKSKPIIDEIDRVLAQHYGFTEEELDFIINYDIKYRMGRENHDDL
ncbi:MAG: Eco57I restriction-modification methylase domain-containing protein [Syntrophales bacterium]|nr:Eco57I restriction-modification methylase domain-containing protein [Syntrophales bacterium]